MAVEVWLRGPIADVDPWLMPFVHSLLQVKEDIDAAASQVDDEQLWMRPGGAASVGFHILHIGQSTERLLTYARGEALTDAQLAAGRREATERMARGPLLADAHAALDRAIGQVRGTAVSTLLEERKVGRAGLPSTALGLVFHVAEHATRHAGQAITTARIVAGSGS
jgi:uncharacterized damage-inducible protein DinB